MDGLLWQHRFGSSGPNEPDPHCRSSNGHSKPDRNDTTDPQFVELFAAVIGPRCPDLGGPWHSYLRFTNDRSLRVLRYDNIDRTRGSVCAGLDRRPGQTVEGGGTTLRFSELDAAKVNAYGFGSDPTGLQSDQRGDRLLRARRYANRLGQAHRCDDPAGSGECG
jgi:hypothetical protein